MSIVQIDFWDVGQGDGSTITLPDNTLIVIDVGPVGSSLSKWLIDKRKKHTIQNLILTHNDADHIGGLAAVARTDNLDINQICLLEDCHPHKKIQSIVNLLSCKSKNIYRLETKSGKPFCLASCDDYTLELRYPAMEDNVLAQSSNTTSGILVLTYKGRDCVSWGSDNHLSTMSQFIKSNADMQFGPHHGAPEDFSKKTTSAVEMAAINKLSPQFCFISVGSHNKYKHPSPNFITYLRKINCVPMCSEVTRRCSKIYHQGKNVHDSTALFSLPYSNSSKPVIQCCGHIRFFLKDGIFEFHQFSQDHINRVKALGCKTLCS